jgi:threonine dehydrogenase-like Zn-dependent dehydrogenase
MRAVVYRGVNDLRLETVPVPRIGARELLVRVAVCGVCPTDIKKIQYGTVPPPRIFGHETAGTVVRAGARVRGFKPGDRVALHHHVPCLDCHFCRHHAFAQCETYKRTGITAGFQPAGGGYAEYVRVLPFVLPGVVKIPAKNSFAEGAMLEPVNTVLKAVRRLSLLPGDVVLVAGQGPIGLMFTRLLQLVGARVIATDLLEPRLRLARKFGAKWVVNVSGSRRKEAHYSSESRSRRKESVGAEVTRLGSNLNQSKVGAEVRRLGPNPDQAKVGADVRRLGPNPEPNLSLITSIPAIRTIDAAVIAVPSDAAVQQALQLIRCGGQVLLFAHTKRSGPSSLSAACGGEGRGEVVQNSTLNPLSSVASAKGDQPHGAPKRSEGGSTLNFPLDLASICLDEKDLLGSYSSDFTLQDEVARLVFSRRLDVRDLISHRFPLEQTAAAVRLASRPTEDSLKIVVCVAGD